jgi:hypothetical protein
MHRLATVQLMTRIAPELAPLSGAMIAPNSLPALRQLQP